jgi:hypothetical protein
MMRAAGMAVTYAGANADLNDPLGVGLRSLGLTTADIGAVTTGEVATCPDGSVNKFLDVAEKRLLDNIFQNLNDVSVFVGPRGGELAQVSNQALRVSDRKL